MSYDPMGTTALVTGASSGFGEVFARRLAERGADLVLVARREDRMRALADELRAACGTTSTVVPLDLTSPGAAASLLATLTSAGITPATVVNNAGFGTFGEFATLDPDRIDDEVAVDVAALVGITRALLPGLIRAAEAKPGSAALVNVASNAAFQPIPRMAVYGASKAFVLSFTEAIAAEVSASGLKVTALCPGPSGTEFESVADNRQAMVGTWKTPDEIVDHALRALDRRRTPPSTIVGRWNAVQAKAVGLAPRSLVVRMVDRITR